MKNVSLEICWIQTEKNYFQMYDIVDDGLKKDKNGVRSYKEDKFLFDIHRRINHVN